MLPCMFCGLAFRRREDLYKHMEDHVSDWGDQPPYACRKCGKSFTKQVRWRKHMLTHSSKRDRRYQCPLCVKTFLTAGHLDVHIRSHTREPLRCDRCERTFTSSVWLQKHAETCSATANFHCDICGRQFGRKSRLTAHLRSSHTGENLFLCEDCGARFSLRANMITHINDVHRNLKLHQCPVCEKVFSRRGILKYHLASAHSEDRGQRLRVQKRSHPAKRSFTCPECGVKFAWRVQLKTHMKRENHSAPPEDDAEAPEPPPEGAQLTTAEEDGETMVIKEEMIETRIKEEETNEETRGEEPMLEGEAVEADKVKRVPDVGVGKSEAGGSGMGCPPSWVDDDISFR